jgi:glycine oxidase
MTVSDNRVVVAGDGVIGLSIAVRLAAREIPVTLLTPDLTGAASPASAGMLAPSVDRTQGPAQAFSDAAPEAWARLQTLLAERNLQFDVVRDGIVHVAAADDAARRLRDARAGDDVWLSREAARRLVPALGEVAGAMLHPRDGFVDVPAALRALRSMVEGTEGVRLLRTRLTSVRAAPGHALALALAGGEALVADTVVLAGGAWSAGVAGLPRTVPVRPLRGVMVAVEGSMLRHPVYDASGHCYLVPRRNETIIGATSEEAGFDATASVATGEALIDAAARLVPSVATARASAPWAGLRPMTPDGRPMIGRDPAMPGLIYACGHGRNGFLQAALTAEVIADLVTGVQPEHDLSPYDPLRFSA